MEGKRVAALCCVVLVVVLMSGQQQQAAALTEFCGCFGDCFPDCKNSHARWFCTIKCLEVCTFVAPQEAPPAAAFGADDGDCSKVCLASICGAADATGDGPTDADAAAACADDCTMNWGRYT